jgi:hypothetical protein
LHNADEALHAQHAPQAAHGAIHIQINLRASFAFDDLGARDGALASNVALATYTLVAGPIGRRIVAEAFD